MSIKAARDRESALAQEEHNRLLYVAMTRARDRLDLIVPQRFYVHGQSARGDRHVYAVRTRFVPDTLLKHFESRAWPISTGDAAARSPVTATVDIKSRMRAMWR